MSQLALANAAVLQSVSANRYWFRDTGHAVESMDGDGDFAALSVVWFIITHAGNCTLARTPSSPADMITADRARSLEDNFAVLEKDTDGEPVSVRVEEPKANGLASMLTFYRGAVRCEVTRQTQKAQLEDLKWPRRIRHARGRPGERRSHPGLGG